MVDLSRYKGIIFDMDGTLVDSMGAHMKAWEMTCEHFGYPFDLDYMYSLGGVPTMKTAELLNQKFNKQLDPQQVGQFKKDSWLAMDHTPALVEDTYAIFSANLGKKKIAVGTGAERRGAKSILGHHNLLEKLDVLVTSSDVENGKPAPDTFLKAAEFMGLAPEQCVVFEDTDIGQQAATSAGMDCILVVNGRVEGE